MARKNAQSFAKRQREQLKQQKRQAKNEKKALRKAHKEQEPIIEGGAFDEPAQADHEGER